MKHLVAKALFLCLAVVTLLGPMDTLRAQRATSGIPVTGDWDGNGTTTPGMVRVVGRELRWYLRNSNDAGAANVSPPYFVFGQPGDTPIVGDWDDNRTDTPGVVRVVGSELRWYLRNSNDTGAADINPPYFVFGQPGDTPIVGDWDVNGTDTPGVVRVVGPELRWYLRTRNSTGTADISPPYFVFGQPGDTPIVGDWDADRIGTVDRSLYGTETAGVVRNDGWHLRNSNDTGGPDVKVFLFPAP